jgi:uncharacterized membrane protein
MGGEEEVILKGRSRRTAGLVVLPVVWLSLALAMSPTTEAGDGVVRAVLFSSPTCPHCQKVREEVLPSLWDRFRGQLQVAVLSTATPAGRDLYWAAVQRYGVLQRGVPLLVVGDLALVGSDEIPRRLPDLVAGYLGQGGVGWPDIPGLAEVLAASTAPPPAAPSPAVATPEAPPPAPRPAPLATPPAAQEPVPAPLAKPEPQPTPAPPPSPQPAVPPMATARPRTVPTTAAPLARPTAAAAPATVPAAPAQAVAESGPGDPRPPTSAAVTSPELVTLDAGTERGLVDRVLADPRGNGLAILVLVGMVAAVLRSVVVLRRPAPATMTNRLDWLNPLLALAGLGVAAYLAHVEVREIEAVCGPVGDCNTVQQSEYARLFGVVPIGVLGVLGFASILVAWGVRRWGAGQASSWATVALLAMTGLGTLFSIYLTFLEPFVIGATCLWCLSSAVIMTTLYRLALPPGRNGGRWGDAFRVEAPARERR